MDNGALVDGEFESLLRIFNFDQCSSDDTSFYNPPSETDAFSSDDFFPFGTILQRNYPAVLDGSNYRTNLYVDPRQELMKPRKKQKLSSENNLVTEPNTAWRDGQSLSSFSSSDDEKALGLTGNTSKSLTRKAKPNKRIASDPQMSLYARKRRERINDRLKTLQSLVPNGTKVDISTMLEDAVHYVKFLQLQIKLLSSEDLWMYAPLAHNGMNMGLHHNLLSRRLFKDNISLV